MLLAILLVAIANFVIGSFIPPSASEKAEGVTGYSGEYRSHEVTFAVHSKLFRLVQFL